MSTDATATTAAAAELPVVIIDQRAREDFDAALMSAAHVLTPLPSASEAFVAHSADVEGREQPQFIAYVAIRHVVSPIIPIEGADPSATDRTLDAIAEYLKSQVRDTLAERAAAGDADAAELHSARGLSYDLYVPEGVTPPEGGEYERLPVTVYRRRVC